MQRFRSCDSDERVGSQNMIARADEHVWRLGDLLILYSISTHLDWGLLRSSVGCRSCGGLFRGASLSKWRLADPGCTG